jgi:hypothetical protein
VAIFVLGSRRRTKLPTRTKPLASGERLVSLVSSAYTIDVEDRQQLTRIFRALSSLAARVPVVRLELRDSAREVVRAAAEVLLYARTLRRAALTNRPPVKQLPAPSLSNGSRD